MRTVLIATMPTGTAMSISPGSRCRHLAGVGACKDAVTIMGGTHSSDWSAVIDGQIVSGRVPVDVPEFLDAITTALLM